MLVQHGTCSCYTNQKCRCDLCKAAQKEYKATYREKNRDKRIAYTAAHKEEIAANDSAYYAAHKEEMNAYSASYRAARYAELCEYVEQFETPCEHCGSTTDIHWHHVDPSTKLCGIADMSHKSRVEIDTEIAKCICLCRSCHKKLHHKMVAMVP